MLSFLIFFFRITVVLLDYYSSFFFCQSKCLFALFYNRFLIYQIDLEDDYRDRVG
jgi:hypothetical protein